MDKERKSASHQAGKADTNVALTPRATVLSELAALILAWRLPGEETQESMPTCTKKFERELSSSWTNKRDASTKGIAAGTSLDKHSYAGELEAESVCGRATVAEESLTGTEKSVTPELPTDKSIFDTPESIIPKNQKGRPTAMRKGKSAARTRRRSVKLESELEPLAKINTGTLTTE